MVSAFRAPGLERTPREPHVILRWITKYALQGPTDEEPHPFLHGQSLAGDTISKAIRVKVLPRSRLDRQEPGRWMPPHAQALRDSQSLNLTSSYFLKLGSINRSKPWCRDSDQGEVGVDPHRQEDHEGLERSKTQPETAPGLQTASRQLKMAAISALT